MEIANEIIEFITLSRFRMFLQQNSISRTGIKSELASKIAERLEELEFKNKFINFVTGELEHGRNRQLFITNTSDESIKKLKDKEYALDCMNKKFGITSKLNIIMDIKAKNEEQLIYFDFDFNSESDKVNCINLCFSRPIVIDGLVDEEGEPLPPKTEMDFIWIKVKPDDNKIIYKIRSRGYEYNTKAKETYQYYDNIIRDTFLFPPSIRPKIQQIHNTLYLMFKELTEKAELPYREKVAKLSPSIDEFVKNSASVLEIASDASFNSFRLRLARLLERVLIQEHFHEYKSYYTGKKGIVDRFLFSDPTGAKVKAHSAYDSGASAGIHLADVYFDIRETVEDRKKFDTLWVNWYIPISSSQLALDDEEESFGREYTSILTKFEVSADYYIIHFLNKYTTKEVEEFVLSNFIEFEKISS